MENNKITITIRDDKVAAHLKSPMAFEDALQVYQTVIQGTMSSLVNHAPETHKHAVKQELYDLYNYAASHLLEVFAPEFELRPNLTTQAILEAENKIIMEGRLPKETAEEGR